MGERTCFVTGCGLPVVDSDREDMGSSLCYWHFLRGCENDDHRARLLREENRRQGRAFTGVTFYGGR